MERKTTVVSERKTTVVSERTTTNPPPVKAQDAETTDETARRCCGAKQRKALPEYDADIPLFSALFSWHGTVMPLVLKRLEFWFLWATHGLFIYLKLLGHLDEKSEDDGSGDEDYAERVKEPGLSEGNWAVIGVPTTLMVFFLVSYANSCYTRFFQMYTHCIAISGSLQQWTALVKLHLGQHGVNVQWNCVRHLHAAAHVQYYTLQGASLSEEELSVIQGRDLLSVEECERVVEFQGFKPLLPIYWALSEVKALVMQDAEMADGAFATAHELRWNEFLIPAMKLRNSCSEIVNLLKQPVPWAYFHLVIMVSFLTLLLISYFLVFAAPWPITTPLYAIVITIVLGLKNVAIAMADPFGDDVYAAPSPNMGPGAPCLTRACGERQHRLQGGELPCDDVRQLGRPLHRGVPAVRLHAPTGHPEPDARRIPLGSQARTIHALDD